MVLTSHYAYMLAPGPSLLNFLWTGVDLFFVISGFVFGPAVFSGVGPLVPYALRRFFRIYPLYFFSLVLYLLVAPADPEKYVYFVRHLFFLGTASSAHEAFFFNPAYWSLPAEVEYYLALPLLALILVKRHWAIWALLGVFLLVRLAIAATATPFSVPEPNLPAILKIHLPGVMIEFLAGVALYWVYRRFRRSPRRGWPTLVLIVGLTQWLALGLFFVGYGDQGIKDSLWLRAYFSFLCAASYSFILFGLLNLASYRSKRFLKIAAVFGSLSFGVYLFHFLVLKVYQGSGVSLPGPVAYVVCLFAVLTLSIIAHYLVESPLRDFGRRLAQQWLVAMPGIPERSRSV